MAKRANPFIDDFVKQSKTHIGLKQFNNNEERLKKVYGKTLVMLYKGGKKDQQSYINHNIEDNGKKDGLKQLFIGTNGILIHSGQMINENSLQPFCKCGRTKAELCAYCEKALCEACECLCTLCQQHFCAECSLPGSEDSVVCVSCY